VDRTAVIAAKFLPWGMGAALLAIIGLGGWLQIERLQRQAAQTAAEAMQRERDLARAETAQRQGQIAALERQAQATRETAIRIEPIRMEVARASPTSVCIGSPVIVRGLERLRATRPAAAGAGGPAIPAGVPARAGGP